MEEESEEEENEDGGENRELALLSSDEDEDLELRFKVDRGPKVEGKRRKVGKDVSTPTPAKKDVKGEVKEKGGDGRGKKAPSPSPKKTKPSPKKKDIVVKETPAKPKPTPQKTNPTPAKVPETTRPTPANPPQTATKPIHTPSKPPPPTATKRIPTPAKPITQPVPSTAVPNHQADPAILAILPAYMNFQLSLANLSPMSAAQERAEEAMREVLDVIEHLKGSRGGDVEKEGEKKEEGNKELDRVTEVSNVHSIYISPCLLAWEGGRGR